MRWTPRRFDGKEDRQGETDHRDDNSLQVASRSGAPSPPRLNGIGARTETETRPTSDVRF